jgi:hypothetical protein
MTCSSAYHKINLYNVVSRSRALMVLDLSSLLFVLHIAFTIIRTHVRNKNKNNI